MKRYKIRIASLFLFVAAFTFSGCNNEEGPDNVDRPVELVDAYLSIAATTDISTRSDATKAGTHELTNEAFIDQLVAFVFTESGSLHTVKAVDNSAQKEEKESITEINNISVKVLPNYQGDYSTTVFQVVLLANCGTINYSEIKTIDDLYNLASPSIEQITVDKLNSGGCFLPMSSNVLRVTNLQWKNSVDKNWISQSGGDVVDSKPVPKAAIQMKRLVARVELADIKLGNLGDFYKGAEFLLDSIYLVNVRTTAHYIGAASTEEETKAGEGIIERGSIENTSSDYFRGGPKEFVTEDHLIANDADENGWPTSTYNSIYSHVFGREGLQINKDGNSKLLSSCKYYIYPSSLKGEGEDKKVETRLVLSCRYRFQSQLDYIRKYFHVVIGKDGLPDGTAAMGVVNNQVYNITINITGEGSPTPDRYVPTADVTVNLSVNGWEVEYQEEYD